MPVAVGIGLTNECNLALSTLLPAGADTAMSLAVGENGLLSVFIGGEARKLTS